MQAVNKTDNDQARLWNGAAGRGWVEAQAVLDKLFLPFEEMLVEAAVEQGPASVLDIGCGTGATTVAIAQRLGPEACCTGVDISQPMVEGARARAAQHHANATFIQSDAQSYAFAPATFDRIVSRFGVMFFTDSMQAFANLRQAATPGARMDLIAWRAPQENAFMTTAERAAATLLPNIPPRRTDAPGQFYFADQERVRGILENSGWKEVRIAAVDATCTMPEEDLNTYLTRIGPLAQLMDDMDATLRQSVLETVTAAFTPYRENGRIAFTASCWRIEARAND